VRGPWRAGLYLRLSRDDGGESESGSIANQRALLMGYAQEHGFPVEAEYQDDGWSGTNFDRPGFRRLREDILAGRINLVLVKDLSRLGRDYIAAGELTERFFPEHGVRCIAVTDGYDSEGRWDDMAPFRHVMNEMYARDLSKKIRSALEAKMAAGQFVGSFPPYGYRRAFEDRGRLEPEPGTAEVVAELFRRAAAGEGPTALARWLDRVGAPTPGNWRRGLSGGTWSAGSVGRLLANPVYTGTLIQGKSAKVSFKSRVVRPKAPEQWHVAEGTHAALVDPITFRAIQGRRARGPSAGSGFQNLFSGLARCGDCGRAMSSTGSRRHGGARDLVCGGYKAGGAAVCSGHAIAYEALCRVVEQDLHQVLGRKETLSRALAAQFIDHIEVFQGQYGPGRKKWQEIVIFYKF